MYCKKAKKQKKYLIGLSLILVVILCASCVAMMGCHERKSGNGSSSDSSVKLESLDPQNVSFVYANRMNSGSVPSESILGSYILASLNAKHNPVFYLVDGSPENISYDKAKYGFDSTLNNEKLLNNSNTPKAEELSKYILSDGVSNAKKNEADVFSALFKAAQSMDSSNNKNNTVVVFDSGISTAGEVLNFRNASTLGMTPDDVDTIKYCPDLSNIDKVVWYGFNKVADQQNQMSDSQSENFRSVYKKYLEDKCGVKEVVFENDPNVLGSQRSHAGLPTVTNITFSNDYSGNWSSIEINNTQLRFKPNTSEFDDPAAADKLLKEVASSIKSSGANATVNGYVAIDGQQLSQARADKVKEKLVENGCDPSKITAVGKNKGHYPNMDPYNPANMYVEIVKG